MNNTTTATFSSVASSSRLRANTHNNQKTSLFQRPVIDTTVPSTYARTRSLTTNTGPELHTRENSSSSSASSSQPSNRDATRPLSPSESIDILGEHLHSHVLALHDFTPVAHNATCLTFRAGQVLNRDSSGWWDGELEGRRGWFPSNYVSGLDQIGRLRDEVLIELNTGGSISSLASWTSSKDGCSTSKSAFPQSHSSTHFPTSRDSEQLISAETIPVEPSEPSSPDHDDFSSSPTIVRNRVISNIEVSNSTRSSTAMDHANRNTSPTFSIYNAIASGSLPERSISPTLQSPHQPLLTPLLHAVSLLNRAVAGRRQAHYQPSTACIISCVRSLLMSTECLHRDAPILKRIPTLARERKVILGNLATLVAQARRCSEWPGIDEMDQQEGWQDSVRQAEIEQQDWELEQMLRMGGEVMRNVTQFLEVCEANEVELPVSKHASSGSGSSSSSVSTSSMKERVRIDLGVATPTATPHRRLASGPAPTPVPRALPLTTLRTKSLNDLRARRRLQHLERSKQVPTRAIPPPPLPAARSITENRSISSISSVSSSSIISASAAAAVASSSFPSGPCSPGQVLCALRTSNDALLSSIAALIGHVHAYGRHAHASSKGHLIELARETVDMVRQLLTIVEAVARHPDIIGRGNSLQISKGTLFEATNKLVESVRLITGSEPPTNKSEDEERQQTLQCATNILKVASDCVAAVKVNLSRSIGDIPFIVCLPVLPLNTSGRNTRVSYLRRRSASVSGYNNFEVGRYPGTGTEPEIEAEVHTDDYDFPEKGASLQAVDASTEYYSKEVLSEALSSGSSKSLMGSEGDRPPSRASRRSSTAETTPATSITPEEKDAFEEKLLHGELPSVPVAESPVPPTPSSPCPSPASDTEKTFANVLAHDYDVRDIAYNSDGAIVGASLDAMIKKLTPHDALVDPAFQQIFMMTWRLFVSPSQLVNALIARFNLIPSSTLNEDDMVVWTKHKATPVKLRVANIIKAWLENHWRVDTDDGVLTQLSQFVRGTVAVQFPAPGQRILDIIRARTISDDSVLSPRPLDRMPQTLSRDPSLTNSGYVPQYNVPSSPSEIPRPTITKALFTALKNKNFTAICVTDFDPLELARQFTIRESRLYLQVLPEEVLELGQPGAPSKNVKAISSLSTAITGWVTECILDESDAKKRTNLVKFFIKLSFDDGALTSRSILAALDSSTISRLHQTWAAIPQKNRIQLDAIRKLADHARNYSEYRSRLRNTSPPAVPFLGLYLTDITFCREGNQSYRVSPRDPTRNLINFNKYHKLARIVQDMQRFQVPYNLREISEVQHYLSAQFDRAKKLMIWENCIVAGDLLVEPRRPADPSIITSSSAEGKPAIPILQLWGLSTLSRKEASLVGTKVVAAGAAATGSIA
ncbi:hypothetical protein Clacol_009820 [Clathrus columnatus]|uniref:Ras GEF n=1 Tax=Clathrus columnatus TaxID=1419009 RepID=A0AAV5ALJ3_9AGAM|nr:hypothetical protein Clacol_009820 [Clathrus columnatus]